MSSVSSKVTNSELIEKVKENGVCYTSKWLLSIAVNETSDTDKKL